MDDRPQFSDRYLVGIDQVDAEHRKLFDIAAAVHDALGQSDGSAMDAARAAVEDLMAYVDTHFANEEALMEAAGYPRLAEHRELHRRLVTQVRDMWMRVELEQSCAPLDLSRFLHTWLTRHIEVDDRSFGRFVKAGASPDSGR
jgi:hemerythrin